MQIQKVIEQLGFSPKEAKVYLAALHLGESHISDIAAKVKLPRSSVQVIIDRLYREGLMNFYVMRRYKYWVAEDPGKLLASVYKKEELMREVMPELEAIKKSSWGKQTKVSDRNQQVGIFREVASGMNQPVLITDAKAEIVYVNEAWEKQFGYRLYEVRGQNPRILSSGKTPKEVHEKMWKTLKAGKMFQSDQIIDRKKNGALFNLLTTVFPIRRQDKTFYVQILDDITEPKRLENLRKKLATS